MDPDPFFSQCGYRIRIRIKNKDPQHCGEDYDYRSCILDPINLYRGFKKTYILRKVISSNILTYIFMYYLKSLGFCLSDVFLVCLINLLVISWSLTAHWWRRWSGGLNCRAFRQTIKKHKLKLLNGKALTLTT